MFNDLSFFYLFCFLLHVAATN